MKRNFRSFSVKKAMQMVLLFTILIAGICSEGYAQQTNTIGTGTAGSGQIYGPMNVGPLFPRWGRLSMIYPQVLLGTIQNGDVINSLEFRRVATDPIEMPPGGNFKIYLKNVSQNDFGASAVDWQTQTADAILVFEGDPSEFVGTTSGFKKFDLHTPYQYNTVNGGNLAVFFEYSYSIPAAAGINWAYDNATTVPNYLTNSAKYLTIQSVFPIPATSSLNNSTVIHPQMKMTWLPPSALNIGVSAYVGLTTTVVPGTKNIEVTIKNYGNTTINSFDVEWSLNGVQKTTYNFSGSLGSQSSVTALLGSENLADGMEYEIKAWTKNPNGLQDAYVFNDTLSYKLIACTSLSGTYTLNPGLPVSSANVHTLTQFVNRLKSCGVSGPVTLNVDSASGPYVGRYLFEDNIAGLSAVNTITLNGNGATLVDTIGSSTVQTNSRYIFSLNGARYITIQGFTIKVAESSTQGVNIHFTNNASYNTIRNNKIINSVSSTSSSFAPVVFGSAISSSSFTTTGGKYNYNLIENNTISGGYYSVILYGLVNESRGNIIRNNKIEDFYLYGIYNYVTDSTHIIGNDIYRTSARSSVSTTYGVAVMGSTSTATQNSKEVVVENNRIHDVFPVATTTSGFYGLYDYYNDVPSSKRGKFINNVIYNIASNGAAYGIYSYSSDSGRYYNNTISFNNPSATGGALYGIYQSIAATGVEFFNNSVYFNKSGTATQYGINFNTTTSTISCDYNNVYIAPAGTGTLAYGRYGTSNFPALADWKTANNSSYDANSISEDPIFVAELSGNLKPTSPGVNNLGKPVAIVPNDIMGVVRNATTPDMGAYEFSPVTDDAGATSFVSPTVPLSPGIGSVVVTVQNFGIVPLNTVTVGWTVNGIAQPDFIYNGGIATGTSADLHIGTYNFIVDQDYRIKAWTHSPNNTTDNNALNDTVEIQIFSCMPLAGNYTVNKSAPVSATNFHSVTSFIDRLKSCGMNASVQLSVDSASGPYVGGFSIPVIPGLSGLDTLGIQGNGATIIDTIDGSRTTSRYLVELNGASHVTIENFSLVLGVPSAQGYNIHLTGGASYNKIRNNKIYNNLTSTSTSYASVVFSGDVSSLPATAGAFRNNIVENNTIVGGYYGIIMYGYLNNSDSSRANIIRNNIIKDFYAYGIYNYASDSNQIIGNNIYRESRTSITSTYSIALSGSSRKVLIGSNRIHDLSLDPLNTSILYGLYFSSNDATSGNEVLAKNNAIYNISNNGTNYGIYNSSSDFINCINNTIVIDNPGATAGIAYGIYQTTLASGLKFYNNNVYVNKGGTANRYPVYFNTATSTIEADNNNYYPVNATALGYYDGASRATLADWQAANTTAPFDLHGFSVDPLFVSVTNGDFTPSNLVLNDAGLYFPEVAEDINGTTRSFSPDIGAFEFEPIGEDIGVSALVGVTAGICAGTNDITVKVNNFGLNVISTFAVEWSVNGIAQTPFNYVGSLASGTDVDLMIGTFNGVAGQSYNFTFWTSSPNSSPDDNTVNDTLKVLNVPVSMKGAYTIGGVSADFSTITAAVNALGQYGVCGPVVFDVNPNAGTYNEQITINPVLGASEINTITFKGNGSTIEYLNTVTASRHVIRLNAADYITIDSFIIRTPLSSSTTTYGWGIQLFNGADYNTIRNCQILVSDNNTSTTSYCPIVLTGSNSSLSTAGSFNGNVIENNILNGGYIGIVIYSSVDNSFGNVIRNNKITNAYSNGIRLYATDSTHVIGNEISRPTAPITTTYEGISIESNPAQTYVFNNKIHSPAGVLTTNTSTMQGIYITGDAPVGKENIIANNVIYNFNNAGIHYGIYNSSGDGCYIYNNSISIDNPASSTSVAYGIYQITAATNVIVKNNVISITKGGTGAKIGLNFATATSSIISDYNHIYMNGGGTNSVGKWGTPTFATMALWQGANTTAPFDLHSKTGDPLFNGNMNLAPQAGSPLAAAGTPLAEVPFDIMGTVRDLNNPFIGAYEFSADFIGPQISYQPALNTSDLSDFRLLDDFAAISDAAGVDTAFAKRPRIYYKKRTNANAYVDNTNATNGWKYTTSTSTASPYSFTIDYLKLFGGKPVVADEIQYFIVAGDLLGNISSQKGTLNTAASSVDLTAANFPLNGTPDSYFISGSVKDTFYVGASETLKSLTSNGGAFQFINTNALGGDVTLIITSSTIESGVHALNKWAETGTGNYSVKIISDQNPITKFISGSYAGGLIRFLGTKNVTIDGSISGNDRYLRFENNTATSNNATIQLISLADTAGCENMIIRNSVILGGTSGNSIPLHIGAGTFPYSNGGGFKNISITNNLIYRGSVGVVAYGTSTAPFRDLTISGNLIGAENNVAGDNIRLYGVLLSQHTNALVANNTIRNIINSAAQQAWGIGSYADVKNSRFTGNKIANIGSSSSGAFGGRGIYVVSGLAANLTIDNNMISGFTGNGSADLGNTAHVGISISGTSDVKLYYNSVSLEGVSSVATATPNLSAALYINAARDLQIKNNTFGNTMVNNADTSYAFAFYSSAGDTSWTLFDYNNFHVNNGSFQGVLGYITGTPVLNLQSLRTATSQNANSISLPVYYTALNDLHVTNAALYQKGNPIAGFTVDIDGDTRSTTQPCIGADEYVAIQNDLRTYAIIYPNDRHCGDTNDSVMVVIENLGSQAQNNFTVKADIAGRVVSANLTHAYAGSLASGAKDTVVLGPYNSNIEDTVRIKAYVSLAGDINLLNDSITISRILKPVPAMPVLVSITNACSGSTGTAIVSSAAQSILWYDAPVGGNLVSNKDTLITPVITQSTTYYAEATNATGNRYRVGPADNTIGAGATSNLYTYAALFTVNSPISIDSVTVFTAAGTGTIVVRIRDAADAVTLYTATYTGTTIAGQKLKIPVGFVVNPGSYRMDAVGSSGISIYRNTAGSAFPYTTPDNSLSITGHTFSGYPQYYYFFYDWNVSTGVDACASDRLAVVVNVTPAPTGTSFTQGPAFEGKFNAGTLAEPDGACVLRPVEYSIAPLTGLNNAGLGTSWQITNVSVKTAGGLAVNGLLQVSGADVSYTSAFTDLDSILVVSARVSLMSTGCDTLIERYVKIHALPQVNLGNDIVVCSGDSIVLDAGAAGSYLWSTGATTQTITVKAAGSYHVAVSGAGGCQVSDTVDVSFIAVPLVDLGKDTTVCQGTAVALDAGNPGSSYLWSTGETTQAIIVTSGGTYTVAVTPQGGSCSAKDTITVTVNTLPVVDLGAEQDICTSDTITLDAGNPGSTYLWSTGETTQAIRVSLAGTYTVTVRTATGCENTGSVVITNKHAPDAAFTAVATDADRGQRMQFNVTNVAPGQTYQWNFGDPTSSANTSALPNPVHIFTAPGSYTITLSVTNLSTGCVSSTTQTITVTGLGNEYASQFKLSVAPNPFVGEAKVSYTLTSASTVSIELYDLLGRKVSTILDSETQQAGTHSYGFRNEDTRSSNGMYLVRLTVDGKAAVIRVIDLSKK